MVYAVALVLCVSCRSKDNATLNVVETYKQRHIVFDKELEYCVILPEVGCGGCIAGGVDFFRENDSYFSHAQRKNMIVFTAINSRKMLFRALGVDSLDEYYCVYDDKNKYLLDDNNAIYPLILSLKNGEIMKAEFQSPYSADVLSDLKQKLYENGK